MILTVDIGNTNIKIGGWDNDDLAFIARFQTVPNATNDEYALKIVNIFQLVDFNPAQFDGAIISSVVPQLSNVIADAIRQVIRIKKVYEISPGIKTGLNIKIDNPATLGSDMVCAGVATTAKYPLPAIIASLGTATAIFAINAQGDFLGGTVAPGVGISLNALSSKTAQLPYISLTPPDHVIGTNTIDSMNAGVVYGNAKMLEGMIELMAKELGEENPTVIATGGMASLIVPYCNREIIINDNLILEGLKIVYDKNHLK